MSQGKIIGSKENKNSIATLQPKIDRNVILNNGLLVSYHQGEATLQLYPHLRPMKDMPGKNFSH